MGTEDEDFHKPKLNQYLENEYVIDISYGFEKSRREKLRKIIKK
jgi:hypothetical protein